MTAGGVIRGRMAMLSHIMLYRSHQARIYGFWRGGLLWPLVLPLGGATKAARGSRRKSTSR